MKVKFFVIAVLFLASTCQQKGMAPVSKDIDEINNLSERYKEAFIHKDATTLASLFTQDATLINLSSQETIVGNNEIAKYLSAYDHVTSIKMTVDSMKLHDAQKATVKGLLTLSSDAHGTKQIAIKVDFDRQDGAWLLEKITTIECQSPPSHFEHLKDLDWLVGSWVNQVEDSVFTCTYEWDPHKNFLTQEFSLTVLDCKQLSGSQIIGWDPVKMGIRSWVFDSDGGVGEGYWSKDGDNWYVTMVYILSDGRKASATHIFEKVGSNAYTFSSTGRDVDGRILPNIGPFKAVRTEKVNQ